MRSATSSSAVLVAAALVSAGGCVAVTGSVGAFSTPLEVTSATNFAGLDDTAVQQANDWEVDSAAPGIGVTFPAAGPVAGTILVAFPSKTLVVAEAGLETSYAFDEGAVYTVAVGADLKGWLVALGWSWTDLEDAAVVAGANRRTLSYEWDGLGLRVGYSKVLTVALDFDFGEGRFTETRYVPSVDTRAVEFERDLKMDLVLGVKGASGGTGDAGAFLELSMIGAWGLRAGVFYGF